MIDWKASAECLVRLSRTIRELQEFARQGIGVASPDTKAMWAVLFPPEPEAEP